MYVLRLVDSRNHILHHILVVQSLLSQDPSYYGISSVVSLGGMDLTYHSDILHVYLIPQAQGMNYDSFVLRNVLPFYRWMDNNAVHCLFHLIHHTLVINVNIPLPYDVFLHSLMFDNSQLISQLMPMVVPHHVIVAGTRRVLLVVHLVGQCMHPN